MTLPANVVPPDRTARRYGRRPSRTPL